VDADEVRNLAQRSAQAALEDLVGVTRSPAGPSAAVASSVNTASKQAFARAA
jgi:hypothetical protein